jgi:predicted nucleic acid-binding protein
MEIVYLETTVFSFYYDDRSAPAIVAMREWTRQFWAECETRFSMMTSVAVLDELRRGELPHREVALRWALTFPVLPVGGDEVNEIVQAYVKQKVMPREPSSDALHLALASFNECDYLVTWNCRHLANANKFDRIRRVNTMLGLKTPDLVTPPELLGESEL